MENCNKFILKGTDTHDELSIQELAEKCDISTRGNLGAAKHLTREDMANIYRMAK